MRHDGCPTPSERGSPVADHSWIVMDLDPDLLDPRDDTMC